MATYFSLWTNTGLAKRAAAEANGTTVEITHMAFGDGGGSSVTPDAAMTALVNENARYEASVYEDEENENWARTEATVPLTDGPWWIREVGLFDADGDMVAVANYPDTYKPTLTEGAAKDAIITIILAVDNMAAIELTVDTSQVMASKAYVDSVVTALETEINKARRRAYFMAGTM